VTTLPVDLVRDLEWLQANRPDLVGLLAQQVQSLLVMERRTTKPRHRKEAAESRAARKAGAR